VSRTEHETPLTRTGGEDEDHQGWRTDGAAMSVRLSALAELSIIRER
jgi:hypothetical protein